MEDKSMNECLRVIGAEACESISDYFDGTHNEKELVDAAIDVLGLIMAHKDVVFEETPKASPVVVNHSVKMINDNESKGCLFCIHRLSHVGKMDTESESCYTCHKNSNFVAHKDIPCLSLHISVNAEDVLRRAKILTVAELLQLTDREMLNLPGMTSVFAGEIRTVLLDCGLRLGGSGGL